MQNQKKPIQQKKPMQNFTAEKWADKIALFIDNFGFLSGFFWHWTIALPSPTSHLAMLHSKIILSDPNRRVKVVLIGFSLFWSRCRTWGRYNFLYLSLHWCNSNNNNESLKLVSASLECTCTANSLKYAGSQNSVWRCPQGWVCTKQTNKKNIKEAQSAKQQEMARRELQVNF